MQFNYIDVIGELNNCLYDKFGSEPSENVFMYSYQTDCNVDYIYFGELLIFNSENYVIENDIYIEDMSKSEFENYIRKQVEEIGKILIKYSCVN